MRNLKKLLAVVVAICVLATFTVPAFADTAAAKTDAQLCTDLGVLKGAGDGVTDAYLATTPTRLQGAIMFLRLKGLEEQALAFTGTDNFADVPATYAADSKAILAYLKAHPELGFEGVGAGNFAPAELMTAKQYYKILLVALGYTYGTDATADFTWNTVLSFGAAHGLSKLIDNTNFTVNDLAIGTIEALKATVKGGTETLVAKLAAADPDFAAKAIAAGLYTVPVVKPAVVSVKTDKLTRVEVTFNKAIDKDTIDDGDFIVDNEDILADDVSLSDDGKVATLKVLKALTTPFDNGESYTISVSGVSDTAGNEIADYEGDFTPVDNVQPTLEGIEFTGPQTVKLTFSEPLNSDNALNDEVTIDSGTYAGTVEEDYNDSAEVTVDIGTELDEGDHTFKVKGFEDFADYSNLVVTKTVNYASIDTAPTATVKEADQSTVTLKFNRPVTGFDSDDSLGNFYQSYSNWHPLEIQDADGNIITSAPTADETTADKVADPAKYYDEVVLVFTNAEKAVPLTTDGADDNDRPLPVGTVKVVVKDGAVKDRWDNEVDGDMILSASVSADNSKPEVKKVTVEAQNEIRVYFTENVVAKDAKDEDNYVIKNSKGEIIKATKWNIKSYNSDDYYATILFNEDLDLGKYTITVEGIADTSLSANTLDKVTKEFEVTDVTANNGISTGWVADGRILYVKYDEEMATTGTYSVLNKDNYRVDEGPADPSDPGYDSKKVDLELDSSVKISMFTSKIVKMVFPADHIPYVDGGYLTIGRVADKTGNLVSKLATYAPIELEAAPVVEAINRIGANKYEIELNEELKSIATGAIAVYDGAWAAPKKATSVKFTNDGEDTVITITVPDTTGDNETKVPLDNYTISIVGAIKSVTGVPMDEFSYINDQALVDLDPVDNGDGTVNIAYADKVGPKVAVDHWGGKDHDSVYAFDNGGKVGHIDTIVITYTEDLKENSVYKGTYKVDGYKVLAAVATGNIVTLTLEETDVKDDIDLDATPTVNQSLAIEDLAGNELAPDEYDTVAAEDYPY